MKKDQPSMSQQPNGIPATNIGRQANRPPSGPVLRAMQSWYGFLARRRIAMLVVLFVLTMIMSWFSQGIVWQTNILLFFSSHSSTVRDLTKAGQEPGLGNSLRMDVHFTGKPNANLGDAVSQLKKALVATGEFQKVFAGISPAAALTAQKSLRLLGPALLDGNSLSEFGRHLTSVWLNHHFAQVAAELAAPDGQLQAARLAGDPLDLSTLVDRKLRDLNPSPAARITRGMITSTDGRHAMLILIPRVPPQNISASERMLRAVHGAVAGVERKMPNLRTWLIGPSRNYVENARSVKKDITLVSIVGTLLVAIAVLVFFRRLSTLVICMIPPIMGVGTALGLAGLLHLSMPLLVLAFAGLICGSTTDYGIQLIAALNRAAQRDGGFQDDHVARAARELLGPISLSVCTSVTGYAALAFSSAPGLRGLGIFVAGATLCIWGVTFLVLPAFFGEWNLRSAAAETRPAPLAAVTSPRWIKFAGAIGFVVLTGFLLLHAARVRYNHHGGTLDGTNAALRRQQKRFFHTWGNLRHRAIVLVNSHNPQKALVALHRLDQSLAGFKKDHLIRSYQTPGTILPDNHLIQRRLARWRTLWTPARQLAVQKRLDHAALTHGFRPKSFSGVVATLARAPTIPTAMERVLQSPARLVPGPVEILRQSGQPALLSLGGQVRLNRRLSPRMQTDWAGELRLAQPKVSILSGDILFYNATARAQAEAENMFPWVAVLILLPMWFYFRRIDLTFISALSLLVGFIWLLGVAQWLGGGLNLLSLVPMLFTMGVAVDYGIYAASDPAWRADGNPKTNRNAATFLCAMTTFLGTAAMLVAGHPALRGIGLTLAAGIAGGYLTSYFLVGPLTRWVLKKREWWPGRIGFLLAAGAARLVSLLVLTGLIVLIVAQSIMIREKPSHVGPIPHWPVVQTGKKRWHCGPAWMRGNKGIWELFTRGTPEQLGYESSAMGASVDLRIENEMLDRLDVLTPNLAVRWFLLRAIGIDLLNLPHYFPLAIQRELYAEALAHPDEHAYLMPLYPRLLAYHALDDISQNLVDNPLIDRHAVGCTGVISTPAWSGDGHLWLARNFDFECGPAFNHQKSITFVQPNHGYSFATVAWPGLAGCVTGMNVKHLGLFINAAASDSFRPIGEPTIVVAREVLQHAENIRQAVDIFRKAHVFVTNIIVVGNGRTGRAAVLEKSPIHFAWRWIHGCGAVTNQLECPVFSHDPVNLARIADSTSNWRLRRATRLIHGLKGHVNEFTLAGLLRDKRSPRGRNIGWGNRNSIDALITTHSVIMDLTAGNIWIAAFPFAEGNYVGLPAIKILHLTARKAWRKNPSLATVPADHFLTSGDEKKLLRCRAHLVAGYAALEAGHYHQAMALAAKAIAENPEFFAGYSLRGRCELALRLFPPAVRDLSMALRQDPPYAARRASLRRALAQARRALEKSAQ